VYLRSTESAAREEYDGDADPVPGGNQKFREKLPLQDGGHPIYAERTYVERAQFRVRGDVIEVCPDPTAEGADTNRVFGDGLSGFHAV